MFIAVPPGFEPRQTDPESVVLPLHHGTIFSKCKGKKFRILKQIFSGMIFTVASTGKCKTHRTPRQTSRYKCEVVKLSGAGYRMENRKTIFNNEKNRTTR